MPAGQRIRANNVYGTISDNPLLIGAVSFTSLGLSLLPAVSGNHAVIVFDPKRVYGEPEIVVVTSHSALGTTATITRAQYGTVARQHPQTTAWAHVPIGPDDYTAIITSGTRPSNPYRGQMIFETDTDKFVARSIADVWQDAVPLGAWAAYTPANTNVTLGNGTLVARYARFGRTIHFMWDLTFGSTTAFTGNAGLGLPVAAASTGKWSASGSMLDSGTQNYTLGGSISSAGTTVNPETTGGGGITATIPFTWAVSDRLTMTGTYEAVS